MAVAAYYAWDRLGRPLDPATPIREFVERMKLGFPRAAHLFSWHADEAHYQAEPPQDHTPFSATGWPQASPVWWVFATDIMHRPDLGVDCNKLFPYWLAEARAGRMPWLKYSIWQAKRYDVRNNWQPVPSSGHFDHVHHSGRTDHRLTSLGTWDPTGGMADMTPEEHDRLVFADELTRDALLFGNRVLGDNKFYAGTTPVWIVQQVADLAASLARIEAALAGGTPAPGGGATPAQVEEIVDRQLDEHFGGAVTD